MRVQDRSAAVKAPPPRKDPAPVPPRKDLAPPPEPPKAEKPKPAPGKVGGNLDLTA